jgi:hypothetical protein
MQMLYNSDSFVVVQFDVPDAGAASVVGAAPGAAGGGHSRGGFEIVDKFSRKEIYLQGAVAETFQRGVQALVDAGPNPELLDEYIAGYTVLAQQPVMLH